MNVNPPGSLPNDIRGPKTWQDVTGNISDFMGLVWYSDQGMPSNQLVMDFDQVWTCTEPPAYFNALGTHHVWKYYQMSARVGG